MSQNKILFAFHPLFPKWNHGIALLSRLCKDAGIDTSLCVLGDKQENTEHYDGPYVAFSCTTSMDYELCLPYMRIAKESGKTVLLGGVWASWGIPADPCVDYVCRGEGERLTDFILSGDDSLFKNPQAWGDLDALPLPDYEIFKGIPFERGLPCLSGKKVLPYVSSRGCPYQCSFCQIQSQGTAGYYRIRNKIEEDLGYLSERYRPDAFWIGDSTPPYHSRKWRNSWGNFKYPFACYTRADISPEHLEWLIDRGMIGCGFGVESGDERFRNEVLKKSVSDDQIYKTVEILKKNGVEYMPFYITDLPDETFLIKTKTAKMIRKIGGIPAVWRYAEAGQTIWM